MTEDILERAEALLKDTDSSVGWSRTMIDLIAEVERKNEMMNIVENTSKYSTARLEEQIEALVIRAIKAERMVERLRSDWRQEHATAETWKEDFKKMQKRLTDSELLRQAQYNQIAAKDARIKELEEAKSRLIQVTENKSNPCGLPLRYTASERNAMASEALEEIKNG